MAVVPKESVRLLTTGEKVGRSLTASLLSKQMAQKITGQNSCILLVEDDVDNRLLVGLFLREAGYLVEEVDSGKEALEKVYKNTYDIILMDIHLPGMDGYLTTQKIREYESFQEDQKRAKIFALTANAFEEDINKAFSYDFSGYIVKPVRKNKFIQFLHTASQDMEFEVLS